MKPPTKFYNMRQNRFRADVLSSGSGWTPITQLSEQDVAQSEGYTAMNPGVVPAQWSRWESGQEGVLWPKFSALMDLCGNDAPLLWMLQARGYDLSSLRKLESETERRLRETEEALAKSELKNRILIEAMHGRVAA